MAEMKHTPLPWKVELGSDPNDFIITEPTGNTVCEPNTALYADASEYDETIHRIDREEALGNAAYIVKACNAYPSLVEAMKEAHALCIGWAAFYQHDHHLPAFHPVHQGIIEKVTNALRAAGEEL